MSTVLQLVTIGLIVLALPYLFRKNWANGTTFDPTTAVSDSNFQSRDEDILPILDQARYDELSAFLINSSISITVHDDANYRSVLTVGTAQNSALRWLVDYDHARLNQNDGHALLERYALAVFYSSSHDYAETHPCSSNDGDDCHDRWLHSQHWMSSYPVCSWYGVSCSELHGQKYVKRLTLKENGIRAPLPNELALLSHCQSIDLGQNQLIGRIPQALTGMNQLYGLFLEDNLLTGKIPKGFWTAGHALQEFYVGTNQISGTVPDLPSNCNIQALGLEENRLTGKIPNSLWTQATNLRTLYLDGNALTGSLPSLLHGRQSMSLQDLRLSRNRMTGKLPPSLFQKMTDLKILYLDNNLFEGELFSTAWRSLDELEELHLYQNKLKGPIPPEFTSPAMGKLKFLYLDNNGFTGTIPDTTRSSVLLSLQAWSVFGNELKGPLPTHTMVSLQDTLQDFQFQDNSISGTIPTEMGLLTELQRVVGNSNLLRGAIPTELGNLMKLETLHLSGNQLEGEFPNDELCFLPRLEMIVIDCDGTNGTIANCDCCRNCSFDFLQIISSP